MSVNKTQYPTEYKSLYNHISELPAICVVEAYKSAFGSTEALAYEWDIIGYVCERYLSAGMREKKIFCRVLDKELSACNVKHLPQYSNPLISFWRERIHAR